MSISAMRRKPNARGFSLLELLLVLTLAPIVFYAVYSNFSVGIRLWERSQKNVPEEDLVIFYLKCSSDLSNALRYSPIPFEGDDEQVSFAASTDVGVGYARYYYDSSKKAIFREQKDFSAYSRDAQGVSQRLLAGVSDLTWTYLIYDKLSNAYTWSDQFRPQEAGELPLAVRIDYVQDATGRQTRHTLFIPAGGKIP